MDADRRITEPFYDPARSYSENYERGPFGAFAEPVAFAQPSAPQFRFLGQRVHTPFGIPAGPLLNGRYVRAALDLGFDIPVYKTVRSRRYAAHDWPNVLPVNLRGDLRPETGRVTTQRDYTAPLSITNSFGVPSFAPEVWQPDMHAAAAYARPGQMVVGSFQGTLPDAGGAAAYIADFAATASLVRDTGVHAIEANLSCPNEGTAHLLCFDTHRAATVCEAIRKEVDRTPLMVKVAYFERGENDARLCEFLRTVGPMVDAIAAINTISAEVVDARGEQALPGAGRLRSGVCGAAIRWAGLEMTTRLVRLREELGLSFAVVGTGGVTVAEDFALYRAAGADAVMSATGAMWNPLLAQQVKALALEEAHEFAGARA
jgi:dihydroorotate dehydrogenase